jgi:hypothetical protein
MIGYVLLFLLFLPQTSPNCGCEDKPQINVLAVVNGIKITKQNLSIDTRTQVSLLQESVIEARNNAINGLITKTLLQAEAKRRGLTTDKLYEVEVIAKVVQPTDDDVRAFYQQKRITQDFKSVKNDIITQLKNEREMDRIIIFTNLLRVGAQVEVSDQPVTPPQTEADLDRVYAKINGVNITSRDVEESLLPLISRVQKQVYALRKQEVDLRINDLLLEQEAKRLGTTPQDLINQNVRTRVMMASEEEARAFYNANKATLKGDFNDHKVQIMQHLLAQELQKQILAYAEQLRKNAAVQVYLTPP